MMANPQEKSTAPGLPSDTECDWSIGDLSGFGVLPSERFMARVYARSNKPGLSVFVLRREDLLWRDGCIL